MKPSSWKVTALITIPSNFSQSGEAIKGAFTSQIKFGLVNIDHACPFRFTNFFAAIKVATLAILFYDGKLRLIEYGN